MIDWRRGLTGVALAVVTGSLKASPASLPWTLVFESPESAIYLLREPARGDRPTARVWYLEDRKIALMISLLNMKTYSSQIQRWEVDCRTRAYQMTGGVFFEGHMGEGKPLRTASARQGYEIAPANPLMNAVFNTACSPSTPKALTPEQRAQLPALP